MQTTFTFGGEEPPGVDTLADARRRVRALIDEGSTCPCCDQFAKRWPRPFDASMARSLLWLCQQAPPGTWVDVSATAPKWLHQARALPKCVYWGLVKPKRNEDTKKRCSGIWAPTLEGLRFADLQIRIPRVAVVYNGAVELYSPETILIRDALGKKYDYSELWTRPDWIDHVE